MGLPPRDWLGLVEAEYLAEFVPAGGAAVKFVVTPAESDREELRSGLRRLAEQAELQFVLIDAATTKVHLMDRVFQALAGQVDWDDLARAFLRRVLLEYGAEVPAEGQGIRLAALAELNGQPENMFRLKVESWLYERLFKDYAMSQELRLALTRLCRAQLDPDDEPDVTAAVRLWLRGELRLISAVKRALIFQKVNRHNARHLLFSTSHWLRRAGRRGLVLVLDISRFAAQAPQAERDELLYYSTTAVLDGYELLRQLIDGTDELEGAFVAVLTGPELTADERRGYRAYQALYQRLADDVRSRRRENPLGALVRIGAG
jgi:bacteriophage exclusion system BrxC/D-like protein